MNGYVYRAEEDHQTDTDSVDACESFLESYAKGNIDIGGPEPPEAAIGEVSLDLLLSGQWAPPPATEESHRLREL